MRHEEAEQVFSPEIGGVERVDVCAKLFTKRAGKIRLRLDRRDFCEPFLERSEASLFDAGRVHVGRVIVGDHPLRCARCRLAGAGLADQVRIPFLSFLKDLEVHAGARAIGRYFGCLAPGAIGISFEIVTWFYGEVAQGQVDPDRLFRRWRSSDQQRHRQRNQYDQTKDVHLHAARLAKIPFEKQA